MGCERFDMDLGAYLDGELGPIRLAELELHLPACERCRATCAAHAALDLELRALPRLESSPQFEARFWARLARAEEATPSSWRERARVIVRSVLGWQWAGVAVATAAAVLWLSSSQPAQFQEEDWSLIAEEAPFELVTSDDYELMLALDALEAWDEQERG